MTNDESDYRVEAYDPRPPGGQQVGVSRAIMVTHVPSGLVAICNSDRSQHRNKQIAMDMILGGLTSPHYR